MRYIKDDKIPLPKIEVVVPPWTKTNGDMIAGRAWIDEVDIIARDIELYWGVDKLRLFVSPELRAKFDRQRYLLNHVLHSGEVGDVVRECRRSIAAWRACDAAARAAGALPLHPAVWECATRDGEVIALCRTPDDAQAYRADGRQVRVVTLDEVAALLSGSLADRAGRAVSGVTVTPACRTVIDPLLDVESAWPLDDPIPF